MTDPIGQVRKAIVFAATCEGDANLLIDGGYVTY